MSEFFSDCLNGLVPYVPGEQPRDKKYIKLNTNESPFAPSPKVIEAIDKGQVSDLRLYSDPTADMLVGAIADYYSVDKDNVVTSNGSDEILAFIFRAFCGKSKGIVFPNVTYGFYKVFAQLFNIDYREIPLKKDFSIDVSDYENISDNVIIANPNAQTGVFLSVENVENLIKQNPERIVVVDEAYVDFGGQTVIPLVKKYKNLIVVQTFSKSRSLAGARVGFCVCDKALADDIKTVKFSFNPYNLNRLSIVAATEAIKDKDYFVKTTSQIIENRKFTEKELDKLGFETVSSTANFLLTKPKGISAKELYLALKQKGVLVRYFDNSLISDYVRITVGSREQMEILIQKTKEVLTGGQNA